MRINIKIFFTILLLSYLFQASAEQATCTPTEIQADKQLDSFITNCLKTVSPTCFEVNYQNKSEWDSKNPENSAKNLMAKLSEDEIAMRLIFSEMLATKCITSEIANGELTGIIGGISTVIKNRITSPKFGKGVRGVVFKKYQFRSSFGGCNSSEREYFLCPQKHPLFKKIWPLVKTSYKQKRDPTLQSAYFYYFPQHFKNDGGVCAKYGTDEVYKKWAKNKKRVLNTSEASPLKNSCLHLYKP